VASQVFELTQNAFDSFLTDNNIVVIDFWATWCEPCKAFDPVFDEVAGSHSDVAFARVDVEKEKTLADEFEIRSVPFVMILKQRTVVYAESGALTKAGLIDLVEQARNVDVSKI